MCSVQDLLRRWKSRLQMLHVPHCLQEMSHLRVNVCVCVCVRACVRVCECERVCACACVCPTSWCARMTGVGCSTRGMPRVTKEGTGLYCAVSADSCPVGIHGQERAVQTAIARQYVSRTLTTLAASRCNPRVAPTKLALGAKGQNKRMAATDSIKRFSDGLSLNADKGMLVSSFWRVVEQMSDGDTNFGGF